VGSSSQVAGLKLLLIKSRALGDTVITTAAARAWKQESPDSEIQVVVPEKWAEVFENSPDVSRVWHSPNTIGDFLSLTSKLRREQFDCVASLHATLRTALLARASGARERVCHFHGFQDANLFSTATIPGKGVVKPILERDLDALRALGLKGERFVLPHVRLTDFEIQRAQAWLKQNHLQSPLLVVGVGASRPTKIWPAESFAKTIHYWNEDRKGSVVVVGTSMDQPCMELIRGSLPENTKKQVLFETTLNIRALAALIQVADCYLGNDSGPKHLSVAVNTPSVTVFGPENPFEWHPYPRNQHAALFLENLDCRVNKSPQGHAWCHLNVCTVEKHKCLRDLTPENVFREILRIKRARA
jgi:heptosyltransferase-1